MAIIIIKHYKVTAEFSGATVTVYCGAVSPLAAALEVGLHHEVMKAADRAFHDVRSITVDEVKPEVKEVL